jgi:hypothetical protein
LPVGLCGLAKRFGLAKEFFAALEEKLSQPEARTRSDEIRATASKLPCGNDLRLVEFRRPKCASKGDATLLFISVVISRYDK